MILFFYDKNWDDNMYTKDIKQFIGEREWFHRIQAWEKHHQPA